MKATKNFLLIGWILCLVLNLAACGKDVYGKYNLTGLEQDGQALYQEDLTAYLGEDVQICLILNEDGTATLDVLGESTEMEYADGQMWPVEDPDDIIRYTLRDGKLTLFQDNSMMFFEK